MIPEFKIGKVRVRILGNGHYLFRSRSWVTQDVWYAWSDGECTCTGWSVYKYCLHQRLAKQIDESIARLNAQENKSDERECKV